MDNCLPKQLCARVGRIAVLVAFGLARSILGAPGDAARLERPVLTNGSVQLTLTGEAGVEYTIYNSPDLQTWTPLLTNSDFQLSRTFDFGPITNTGFFRATHGPLPAFSAALMATGGINLNGKNFQTDSFDSADPNYSDNGLYPSAYPERQKDNGHLLTATSITLWGTQKVKGYIRTAPTKSITLGTNNSVGSKSWVEGNTNGIQPGYGLTNMNQSLRAKTVPPGTYYYPPSGTVDGVFYNAILLTNNYWMNNIGSGAGISNVLVQGNVRLWIQAGGNINMSGNNVIRITTNASLTIYMGGATAKFGGNGVVNETGTAAAFYYFGLASNTSVDIPGNANFTGTILAPTADFQLGGGGVDTYHFIGASISKTFKLNGNFYFHFDENLVRVGPRR